ncbi:proQ/FINO family protein [Escherichia coli]|uniref:ProQ/FINO family protein n=1 Tax=Escherichia coli TaxID=562 RepID=UPI0007A04560|nr:ProQ/FINO family protein [Escherichia coli]EMC8921672.1 proQ/FINO family protein [Shigella sonnei]EER9344373.1 proQ/FINO family protein [Escherichia coli]EER9664651.1 proQ/FINO family protein [Escherichia coli]EET0039600.1 proQ/FINO family protein [Escherichia coli]EET3386207.1 proQ/FINO family protein [Escherichia coli]
MGKDKEEKKNPVIVVKKRRSFSPPSLAEKKDVIAAALTEQATESVSSGISSPAVETHIPEAPARKKKKRQRFPRPSHWTSEFTHDCLEKVKVLFPQLRAEGGGFLPLKTGITRDITTYLAAHPETALTLDEWYCAVSCITSRRIYLQRTSVAGTPRYNLDGQPEGEVSECDAQNSRRRLAAKEQRWLSMKSRQENISESSK